MKISKRVVVGAVAAVALAGGTAAVATTSGGKQAEQEVLSDAAERLGVSADELRDALAAAQDEQLDQAVEDGRLTREQADAIKEHRRQDGTVLGGPGGPHHGGPGFGPRGPGGPPPFLEDTAKALGISVPRLLERLHDGESLADIAKAKGKDIDDVPPLPHGHHGPPFWRDGPRRP